MTVIDHGVSKRQAFGGTFKRPAKLVDHVAEYREGLLALPPHPAWSGDFADWTADPYSDRNWQFQHHTLRWLNPLRWAALEGDAEARDEWIRVVRSWAETNLPAEDAPSPFAWIDMGDGNRAVQLSLGAPLVPDSERWFVELLEAHRDWLMDDRHIAKRNHALHQNIGLLVVGAALRDEDAMETARARMVADFETAFDAEGCNDEGSAAYHKMNLRWWRDAWRRVVAEGLDVPEHVTARLDAASLALAHLTQPDGDLPQIGDGARTRIAANLGDASDYVATAGKRGAKPTSPHLLLHGGWAFTRSGWGDAKPVGEESHTVIRHGLSGRAHSHFDSGSVHLYAGGRRWLVDPGFHSYQKNDPTREHVESRRAHNVPSFAGRDRDENEHFQLVSHSNTDAADHYLLVDHGWHDAVIERRITYVRAADCWIVWDRGIAAEPLTLEQHWQTDVGVTTHRTDDGFELAAGDRSLAMTWLLDSVDLRSHEAAEGVLPGWVGTGWKTLEPATQITASSTGTAPHIAVLIAGPSRTPLAVVRASMEADGTLRATITRGAAEWTLAVGAEGAEARRTRSA